MGERSPPDSPQGPAPSAATPAAAAAAAAASPTAAVPAKNANDLSYMHRPPRIVPNYGKKHRGTLPKSNISRVLLYDNVTQQQMLDVKISHLRAEQRKTSRLMDMHRKSFIVRRLNKQRHQAETMLQVNHDLPVLPVKIIGNGVTAAASLAPVSNGDLHAGDVGSGTAETTPYLVEQRVVTKRLSSEDTSEDGLLGSASPNGTYGREREDSLPLPSLPQERYGASTSYGFVQPDVKPAGKRTAQTAMMYRELIGPSHTLPDIHNGASGPVRMGKVVLRVDSDQQGLTRMLHTFQDANKWAGSGDGGRSKGRGKSSSKGKEKKTNRERMTEDDRYRKLEKLLVRIEPPNEGYLELSPSFHSPRQPMTFTRPSSFHSSSFRRYSRPSSISPGPFVVSSL